jgi:hypothetical protein
MSWTYVLERFKSTSYQLGYFGHVIPSLVLPWKNNWILTGCMFDWVMWCYFCQISVIFCSHLNSNMHQGGFCPKKYASKRLNICVIFPCQIASNEVIIEQGVHMDHTTWHVVNLLKSVDSNRTWYYLLLTHKISYSTSMHCTKYVPYSFTKNCLQIK